MAGNLVWYFILTRPTVSDLRKVLPCLRNIQSTHAYANSVVQCSLSVVCYRKFLLHIT